MVWLKQFLFGIPPIVNKLIMGVTFNAVKNPYNCQAILLTKLSNLGISDFNEVFCVLFDRKKLITYHGFLYVDINVTSEVPQCSGDYYLFFL